MESNFGKAEANESATDPLTRIRGAYTLAATNEAEQAGIEELMVKQFIQTLADISISVASRRLSRQEPNQ